VSVTVGQFVYQNYSPQKAGKVTAVHPESEATLTAQVGYATEEVTVLWHNSKTSRVSVFGLGDFVSLVTDLERKLENHRKMLKKLRALP
jgi:hypothetical protein